MECSNEIFQRNDARLLHNVEILLVLTSRVVVVKVLKRLDLNIQDKARKV
jgi:hypothetical protein